VLAHDCARADLVPGLLARASSLSLGNEAAPFATWNALAQVIGYCAPGQETLLAGWLEEPSGRGRAAARTLAAMASRTRSLDPQTLVALLRRPELEETWFALSQLDIRSTSLQSRIFEQGAATLKGPPEARPYWLLRALAHAGVDAVPLLVEVANDVNRDLSLRTAAATSLSVLGAPGQAALAPLVRDPDPALALVVLGLLDTPRDARADLQKLLDGPPKETFLDASLRCAAAAKVSPLTRFDDCSPKDRRLRQLAWIAAFAVEAAAKHRESPTFRAMFDDADPVVVQAALNVFAHEPKRPEYDEAVRQALSHRNPGVVARAAEVLSRVAESHPTVAPSRETVQALKEALLKNPGAAPVPTVVALLRAARSLEVLSLRGALPRLCGSASSAVRRAVDETLQELHAERCPKDAPRPLPAATPLGTSEREQLVVQIDGKALSIRLSPTLPIELASRLRAEVAAGAFDQTRIAVAQTREWLRVGDPEGDGYPNGSTPPLTSLPSGEAFVRYSVAFWQHGIDAANVALVIALEDRPDFDADHTLVGTAGPEWDRVLDGATLERAHVEPAP
jgi:hypothetical protein